MPEKGAAILARSMRSCRRHERDAREGVWNGGMLNLVVYVFKGREGKKLIESWGMMAVYITCSLQFRFQRTSIFILVGKRRRNGKRYCKSSSRC